MSHASRWDDEERDRFKLRLDTPHQRRETDNYSISEDLQGDLRMIEAEGSSLEPLITDALSHSVGSIELHFDDQELEKELKRAEQRLGDKENPLIASDEIYRQIQGHADPEDVRVAYNDRPGLHDHEIISAQEAYEELEQCLDRIQQQTDHLYDMQGQRDTIHSEVRDRLNDNQLLTLSSNPDLTAPSVSMAGTTVPLSVDPGPGTDTETFDLEIFYKHDGAPAELIAEQTPDAINAPEPRGEPHYDVENLEDSYRITVDEAAYQPQHPSGELEVEYRPDHDAVLFYEDQGAQRRYLDHQQLPLADEVARKDENNGVYTLEIAKQPAQ